MDDDFRTPGQFIGALLESRGWSQRLLSAIVGIKEPAISKIIQDKQDVTAEIAILLSEVFGEPAEKFLDLQKTYALAKARIAARPDPGRAVRANLFSELPVKEMADRGWIRAQDMRDVEGIEAELARFFGATSPREIEILPHAAKKTNVDAAVTPAQLAWLYRVRHIATEMLVPRYSPSALRAALPRLAELKVSPEAARKVPRILAECGVRFALVETLTSAKIDGVCFWLDDVSPVVGMTTRHDRIDNFWFVLRHELEHVLCEHGKETVALDAELEGKRASADSDVPQQERMANAAAAAFCVPPSKLAAFVARKSPYFAERDILGFSRTLGVHPGLVAGQLQHATGRYELFRKFLVKIRYAVAPSAMVDGWGDVAPVEAT